MELYNYYPCHSLITNLGRIKYTFINGKEYIVAPMTTIVPGVLNGSKGALYYPPDEIKRNVREWDNIPITVYHPDVAGRHTSASEPGVMERQGIGFLAKSEYKGKLVHEGYFDIERTKIVDNRILEALETGQAIELSTGLFTENEPAIPGANYNGKGYEYIARNYKPDHLAVLPDQIGACSILDGCGVLVNSFFVDHLESHRMNNASYVSSNEVQDTETIDNTDNSYTSSIHGNGAVDIDLATDLREGSSKGSINNSTAPYINGDTSTHSILHRMFEWLVSNSGISRVDIAVNSNPEGINQYTKGGATSEAAKASSKLSGSAKGKEALGLAQRAMASSGSGNSEKAAARHTEAAVAHRESAKAGGKDSTSHLQAAELHEKAAELHKADKPGSGTTPSPTPRTTVPATKPVSAPSPSPKSASTPATVAPPANKPKASALHVGTLTPAHVVQAIKDVHKGGLADMADVREHELLKGHSKEHQDEAIAKARSEGKVSGSSYEGRHGISERQKAAVHVDKWGEKIGGLAVRNEESNTENISLEHNAMGRGNWSLPKRSERANSLTEKADQASSNIDDDSTKEDHLSAFQAHKEAADAHRMAAREAATGSSRGGEKDFAASGYHANKAVYHADKADQHGKECGMVENDSTIPTPSTPNSPTAPPAYTATLPGIKSGRQKKLKPGKASAYGSGEAQTKIEDSEDRFKPVVPAPPASQKLTPPSSTEPLPSSNANPISRDSEGQFTSKDKDKRATSSDSKGSNSGSKSSGFSDPEDDNPEEGDEEKVARLRGVGAYNREQIENSNPEGCNQYTGPGCDGGGSVLSKKDREKGEKIQKARELIDKLHETGSDASTLAEHLGTMTVEQLTGLKKEYGFKASGKKADIVAKLAKQAADRARSQATVGVQPKISKSIQDTPSDRQVHTLVPSAHDKVAKPADTKLASKGDKIQKASELISRLHESGGDASHASILADHLKTMTVVQLNSLKKEHGFKASGLKADIVRKLAQQATDKAKAASKSVGVISKPVSEEFKIPDGYKPPHATDTGDGKNAPNPDLGHETRPNLTKEEAEALTEYTRGRHDLVNGGLREGKWPNSESRGTHAGPSDLLPLSHELVHPVISKAESTHNTLQEAFSKATPLEKPVDTMRGLFFDNPIAREQFLAKISDAHTSGKEVTMKGYTSTTTAKGQYALGEFEGNIRLEISARKGLDTSPYTGFPKEKELLLDHNSRFRVHSIEEEAHPDWGKVRVIKMEQIL